MNQALENCIIERFKGIHHRQLLVIGGAEVWCLNQIEQLVTLASSNSNSDFSILSCRSELPKGVSFPSTNNSQYRHHLGREYDWVIYNCWQGVRANAMAALAGTVKSNGLMILLCPSLDTWQKQIDKELSERISYGQTDRVESSLFIELLSKHIITDDHTLLCDEKGFSGSNSKVDEALIQSSFHEQNKVVAAIEKVLTGHRNRPLVISADRGRGKTSALGIAAGRLIDKFDSQILVCAPQKASVETLFKHARGECRLVEDNIKFVAIDDLIQNQPSCDLLIIDEAAGFPVSHLKKIAQHYRRVVFSTTVHGYEGTGRGFDIRFKPYLAALRPELNSASMEHPIRWYANDCLETFWWKTLQLKPIEDNNLQPDVTTDSGSIKLVKINKRELLHDEVGLNQIFNLLVEAHYQTTPDDLVALLDAPDQHIFVIKINEHSVGVILTSEEGGGFSESLSTNVVRGHRRVQGHLLAQQLAFNSGDISYLSLRYLRVVRIAINDRFRRQGIGKQALAELQNWAQVQDMDFIGTSFGASAELVRFWQHNEFQSCLLGYHKDKATAEFSLLMLKPLRLSHTNKLITLQTSLLNNIEFHCVQIYQHIDNDVLIPILEELSKTEGGTMNEQYQSRLTLFAKDNRSLESSAVLVKTLLDDKASYTMLSHESLSLLVDFTLKKQPIPKLVDSYKLAGKKALQTKLREICCEFLSHYEKIKP